MTPGSSPVDGVSYVWHVICYFKCSHNPTCNDDIGDHVVTLPLMSLTSANDNVNVGTHDTTNTKTSLRPHIELQTAAVRNAVCWASELNFLSLFLKNFCGLWSLRKS